MPKRKSVQSKHARKPRQASAGAPATPVTPDTFPASTQTPGQARSRASFEAFQQKRGQCTWWEDFLRLMQDGGFQWRIAAYIAWASSPARDRWPATLKELCDQVLGCSDRVVRKWRERNPAIEAEVAKAQVAPLMRHRRDVIDALVTVASSHKSDAHPDRKLFLAMTGDYKPAGALEVTGRDGGPVEWLDAGQLARLEEDDLDRLIGNLEAIQRAVRGGAAREEPAPGEAVAAHQER